MGPSEAFIDQTSQVTIDTDDTILATLTLPEGSYVFHAATQLSENFLGTPRLSCRIRSAGTIRSTSVTYELFLGQVSPNKVVGMTHADEFPREPLGGGGGSVTLSCRCVDLCNVPSALVLTATQTRLVAIKVGDVIGF